MNEVVINKKTGDKKMIAAILILLAIAGGIFFYMQSQSADSGMQFEENATMGALPGIDMEQRKKEMQQQLDESMIAFSVNTSPVFASGTSEGNIMLENPEHNAKFLMVEIYLNDTNELVYQSKAMKPGSYLETIKLDKALEKGAYEATVYFKAYHLETQKYIGQTGAAVTITVES